MSEIEKLYENAGIEPTYIEGENLMEYSYGTLKYPPFTAEKQINLTQKLWELKPNVYPNFDLLTNYSYSEMIAELANHIWQDLTEEERTQIKEILE